MNGNHLLLEPSFNLSWPAREDTLAITSGGTDIAAAIRKAATLQGETREQPLLIIVTDGPPLDPQ